MKDRLEHSKLTEKHFPIAKESMEEEKDNSGYRNNNSVYLEYECCENACMVYIGDEKESLYCRKCSKTRYLPCCLCANAGIETSNVKCEHILIPRRTIRYRSIKLLIIELLQYDTFLEVIKFKFNGSDELKYQSFKDGESYKRNKSEMEEQFKIFKLTYVSSDPEFSFDKIESLDLFLSWFFDGTQLFTSRLSDFCPMYVSFLNLPSCLRHLNGAGSFLVSLFNSKHGDPLEDFLLNDCFIAELIHLAEGFLVKVGEKLMYLQLRLIQHIQDLIGFNNSLKCKNMALSYEGCLFCNSGGGQSVKHGNTSSVKYLNNRHWLSLRDPTRTNGFSRICCPLNFYSSGKENMIKDEHRERGTVNKIDDYLRNQINLENLEICEATNKKKSQNDIYNFLKTKVVGEDGIARKITFNDTKIYCWFSNNENYEHFKPYLLFYPHCCYKMPRGKWKRTTDKDWIERILECQETGKESRGIKGAWPFYQLPYASIASDVSPSDPAHTWKNIFSDVLKQMKSEVDSRASSKQIDSQMIMEFKKAQTSKTEDDKVNLPWSLSKTDMDRAEAFLNCMLIPTGVDKVVVAKVFRQSGHLKISDLVTVFTVLINLILLASRNMKFSYKQYLRMLAEIVNRSKNNNINKTDVDPLFWRAKQWLALSEGLLPMTEMTITKHFVPDIVKHIHEQGPVTGWHALNGETLVAKAKRKVKRNGGRKIENSAYFKLFEQEKMKIAKVYGEDLKEMQNSFKLNKDYDSLYYDNKQKSFIVDFDINDLSHGSKRIDKLSSFEYEMILNNISNEIIDKYIYPEDLFEILEDELLDSKKKEDKVKLQKYNMQLGYYK